MDVLKTLRDLKQKIKDNLDAEPTAANVGADKDSMVQQAIDAAKKRKKDLKDVTDSMDNSNGQ